MTAPDRTYAIVSEDSSREWADAPDLDSALFGAKTLALEEKETFVVLDPNENKVGWAAPDGIVTTIQGARR